MYRMFQIIASSVAKLVARHQTAYTMLPIVRTVTRPTQLGAMPEQFVRWEFALDRENETQFQPIRRL